MEPNLDERLERLVARVLADSPLLLYHNKDHLIDVHKSARMYAAYERLGHEQIVALEPAALLHDMIYVPGRKDNVIRTAEFARKFLPEIGYTLKEAEQSAGLIKVTGYPSVPKTLAEMILVDSDFDSLGRPDFFSKNEAVREEMGIADKQQWYRRSIALLENHKYHTQSALRLRGPGKAENLKRLYELVG